MHLCAPKIDEQQSRSSNALQRRDISTIILTAADFNRLVDVFEGQNKDAMVQYYCLYVGSTSLIMTHENRSTFDVD